ncbi:3'-5' exonuclease [Rhodopseudomonas palustris]|uniref:3'-5' exonuclease n=1 Tax=Rhodopseudomonas palustris TaxID=1076 RepID=UPI0020CC0EB1|nr:3'-5' exonuclease [Rhodopseudomonas palustris]MCP9630755.1 3'-5' exonuclease [Rhodopseudomonas palustris]
MSRNTEVFVSVDVETAGPIPGEYSLLSIGACIVDDPAKTFSCELKPINRNADPKALEVSGLSMDELAKNGLEPAEAMQAFAQWLDTIVEKDGNVVFVGLNAPFDWSFVNYYFHRFTGGNPFGFTAVDIKALFMGATGCNWTDTRSSKMAERLSPRLKGDHQALHDAQYQAELFSLIRTKLMGDR